MELEAELRLDELRDGGRDAAELRMAERILAAGLREEPAVGIARAFGDDHDAVLVLRDAVFDTRKKRRFVERDFGKQNDVRRVGRTFAREAARRRDPARVPAHDLEHEYA